MFYFMSNYNIQTGKIPNNVKLDEIMETIEGNSTRVGFPVFRPFGVRVNN